VLDLRLFILSRSAGSVLLVYRPHNPLLAFSLLLLLLCLLCLRLLGQTVKKRSIRPTLPVRRSIDLLRFICTSRSSDALQLPVVAAALFLIRPSYFVRYLPAQFALLSLSFIAHFCIALFFFTSSSSSSSSLAPFLFAVLLFADLQIVRYLLSFKSSNKTASPTIRLVRPENAGICTKGTHNPDSHLVIDYNHGRLIETITVSLLLCSAIFLTPMSVVYAFACTNVRL
jgi:hypothetical protein